MNIITGIILLGIVHGFILGIFLLSIRRGNQSANGILGIIIILFSYTLSPALFLNTGLYKTLPHLMLTANPVLFLFGPLFLFYVKFLTSKEVKFKKVDLFHFSFFILHFCYLIPFYIKSGDEKLRILEKGAPGNEVINYLLTVSFFVQVLVYIVIVYRTAKIHSKNLENTFSSIEKINLKWIQTSIRWLFVVLVMMIVNVILYFFGYANFVNTYSGNFVPLLVVIIIYSIGYRSLWQPEIFASEVEEPKKYNKSVLELDKAQKYLEHLISYMESEKPFLKSDLTLKNLSEMSGIPYYHLSRIINENLKQNFFDFVNRYRIEEAKKNLIDPKYDHYTILGIAIESGFNSKSAFNTAFKKYTNTTPSQFRSK